MKQTIPLAGGWVVDVDKESTDNFRVYRPDSNFFYIEFDSAKHGQPVVVESEGDNGITGKVVGVVSKVKGEWRVLVTRNDRPANGYSESLVEGSRHSVTNDNPFLDVRGYPMVMLSGYNHNNSARIRDKILFGVVVDHGGNYPVPPGAFHMTFQEFFSTSTDTLTKACLGQFLVEIVGVV